MMQVLKGLIFLIKFSWILFVEKVKHIFSIHQDYESFIVGITNKLIQFDYNSKYWEISILLYRRGFFGFGINIYEHKSKYL